MSKDCCHVYRRMVASCEEVYKWNRRRTLRQLRKGSAQQKKTTELALFALKNRMTRKNIKQVFLKNCKKDKARFFYKNEKDYNTKMDKFDKVIQNMDPLTQQKEMEKKIHDIFYTK